MKRLHLGCGGRHLEGWENVDGRPGPGVDRVVDVQTGLGGFEAEAYEWVYSSHVVEHIFPDKLPEVLRHLYRLLAPGGKLTIATISLEGIFRNAFEKGYSPSAWNSYIYGDTRSTDHPYAAHRQAFTEELLGRYLRDAGFKTTRRWALVEYPEIMALDDCARSSYHVTLYLEGLKA